MQRCSAKELRQDRLPCFVPGFENVSSRRLLLVGNLPKKLDQKFSSHPWEIARSMGGTKKSKLHRHFALAAEQKRVAVVRWRKGLPADILRLNPPFGVLVIPASATQKKAIEIVRQFGRSGAVPQAERQLPKEVYRQRNLPSTPVTTRSTAKPAIANESERPANAKLTTQRPPHKVRTLGIEVAPELPTSASDGTAADCLCTSAPATERTLLDYLVGHPGNLTLTSGLAIPPIPTDQRIGKSCGPYACWVALCHFGCATNRAEEYVAMCREIDPKREGTTPKQIVERLGRQLRVKIYDRASYVDLYRALARGSLAVASLYAHNSGHWIVVTGVRRNRRGEVTHWQHIDSYWTAARSRRIGLMTHRDFLTRWGNRLGPAALQPDGPQLSRWNYFIEVSWR